MGGADVAIPWAAHPDGGWYEINSTYWALDEEQKRPLNANMAEFGRPTEKFINLAAAPGLRFHRRTVLEDKKLSAVPVPPEEYRFPNGHI